MSGHHPYHHHYDNGGRGGPRQHPQHPQQHQQHMHAQAQPQAFQPGVYQYQGQQPMQPMPTQQHYHRGPAQLQPPVPAMPLGYGAPPAPQGYYPQQPSQHQHQHQHHQAYGHQPQYGASNGSYPYPPQAHQQQQQQQQQPSHYHGGQPQPQPHHHHAPPPPAQHYHHQQPPHAPQPLPLHVIEQQLQQQQQQPAAPAVDVAVAEAEVRKAVVAALSTPSLLRGAASGAGAGGGYTFAHHKSGRGKHHQAQQQQQQGGNLLKKLQGGALPFDVVCALPGVKRAAQGDRALVQRALEASEVLVVAGSGKQQRVARRDMLPGEAAADLPYRCVLLTRLPPEKATEAGVKALVAAYGPAASAVVVGGEQEEGGSGLEGEEEATAAGRGPPMLEVKAVVEFAEGKAAVKCVEALSGGSDWRRGLRAEFALGGFTLQQAAKHFGVELAGANGGGGGTEDGDGAGTGVGGAATSAGSGSASGSSASAMPASVRDARLPPTFPEGTHTGVVMEMVPCFASVPPPPAAEGAPPPEPPAPLPVRRGVIKREGRVRNQISFEVPAAGVAASVGVGARVDFVVKHVDNKAVVVSLKPSTAPPPAPVRVAKKEAGSAGGGGAAPFVQAKGPDEKGGVGFLLPRTKPGEAMQGLLDGLRQLKLGAGKSG